MSRVTTPEQIAHAEKVRKGLLLRRQGASYAEIARDCGWESEQAAHKAIKKAIRAIPQDEATEYRAITNARIDRILMSVLPKANNGDGKAIERFVALEARRSRMCGYDAAVKIADTDANGKDKGKPATATVRIYIPDNGREQAQAGGGEQGSGTGGDG